MEPARRPDDAHRPRHAAGTPPRRGQEPGDPLPEPPAAAVAPAPHGQGRPEHPQAQWTGAEQVRTAPPPPDTRDPYGHPGPARTAERYAPERPVPAGHISNGHSSNGHPQNGHAPPGHLPPGHPPNEHVPAVDTGKPAAQAPGPAGRAADMRSSLDAMLVALVHHSGSDLHLTVGAAPTIRVHGSLRPLDGYRTLNPHDTAALARSVCGEERWQIFREKQELDFAYSIEGVSRFRVNLFVQRGHCGAVFRAIPDEIKPLASLGVPEAVAGFAQLPRGLVLVTGPTGSGKTTTLASLIDLANADRACHIVTIEDPIEFLHPHRKALVNQREVGADTDSFATALKHALRQDPDIILVGELRDLETTSTALTAAETGHLVFATLHTQSAMQTVDRIIDIFPGDQQRQVRTQLSTTLQGVVTQALAPRADGTGRTVITEVMLATPAIRALIREGKTYQIPSFIQSGASKGMVSFDHHLAELVRKQVITLQQALELCHSTEEFERLAGRR